MLDGCYLGIIMRYWSRRISIKWRIRRGIYTSWSLVQLGIGLCSRAKNCIDLWPDGYVTSYSDLSLLPRNLIVSVYQCPHLSVEELRNLHISNQTSFNASATYARLRLDEGLAPGCALTMRPKLSFGSPNKTKDTPPSLVLRPSVISQALVQPQLLSPVVRTPTSMASGARMNEREE
jgi:hypothetical protein